MIAVIQRVKYASVTIEGNLKSSINNGLLILLGVASDDSNEDINYIVRKSCALRIFSDNEGKMNKSVVDIAGEILLVSQFTLYANTKNGNRPSFELAAKPDIAIPLYEKTIRQFEQTLNKHIKTGTFGADMKVELLNDGPVTIIINSKEK
ncbi:MAG: D-aminoacyl-tRNA deacylase [Bacteroidota bacterium]|nr:D-aminoacyl-tRNA deacylase [Bacteroidota bacterium]